jgi:hypothetical protein
MNQNDLIRNFMYGFIALLVSGNMYFIKNLVGKLDNLEERVWQLRQEVVVLSVRIDTSINKTNRGQ